MPQNLVGTIALKSFLSYIHGSSGIPQLPQEPFSFLALPKDMQLVIIELLSRNTNAQTLEEAAQTIKSLSHVNKELNALLNDPHYCLHIIKYLSERYNCSNEMAAITLGTSAAKKRLELQDLRK